MKRKHTGADLIGIILVYIGFATNVLFKMFLFFFPSMISSQSYLSTLITQGIFGFSSLGILVVVILYHCNVIKSHIIPGVLALFISIIGGILILANNPNKEPVVKSTSIEQRLQSLESLYQNGLISRHEYDSRRKEILDQFI